LSTQVSDSVLCGASCNVVVSFYFDWRGKNF